MMVSQPDSALSPQKENTPPPAQPTVIVVPVVVVVAPPAVPAPIPQALPAATFAEGKTTAVPAEFASPPSPKRATASSPPGILSRAWRKIGGTGFAVSCFLHGLIFVFAALWIVAEWTMPAEAEPAMFVSGSGGGARGNVARARRSERNFSKKPSEVSGERARIVSLNAGRAQVVLPALPENVVGAGTALRGGGESGTFGAGGSEGAGTGLGGGIGAGLGVGVGNGKAHLGKFKTLLGTKIQAKKIAVYLDCSGSMKSYLPAVKAEIYEKFPDADVFAYSGAQTEVADGVVVGGKSFKTKAQLASARSRRKANIEDETEVARLSSQGSAIYKKYAAHFAAGTAGAWLDILSRERYDAIVVFSDFRDGVRQRRNGKTVFADSAYSPVEDGRDAGERRWERDWVASFSRKGAPRLYLFSVRSRPQEFLQKCVEASGGESVQLSLKKSGKKESPPADPP